MIVEIGVAAVEPPSPACKTRIQSKGGSSQGVGHFQSSSHTVGMKGCDQGVREVGIEKSRF